MIDWYVTKNITTNRILWKKLSDLWQKYKGSRLAIKMIFLKRNGPKKNDPVRKYYKNRVWKCSEWVTSLVISHDDQLCWKCSCRMNLLQWNKLKVSTIAIVEEKIIENVEKNFKSRFFFHEYTFVPTVQKYSKHIYIDSVLITYLLDKRSYFHLKTLRTYLEFIIWENIKKKKRYHKYYYFSNEVEKCPPKHNLFPKTNNKYLIETDEVQHAFDELFTNEISRK